MSRRPTDRLASAAGSVSDAIRSLRWAADAMAALNDPPAPACRLESTARRLALELEELQHGIREARPDERSCDDWS